MPRWQPADITLYDADTGTNRVVSVRDFLIGAAACEMPPTWNDDTLLAQMVASHSYALALGAPMPGQFGPLRRVDGYRGIESALGR